MAIAMTPSAATRTLRGSGLDRVLPYFMLGPTLFLVLGVIVYPLIDGLRSSTGFFRFGRLVRSVGLDNYARAFADPAFVEALLTTARFDLACGELLAGGARVEWQSREDGHRAASRARSNRSKTKYTCPGCGVKAWAKPDVRLLCGDCGEELEAE